MSASENRPVRVRVIYRGRVQGVGFRYTTCAVAKNLAVTGYVKNLRDGSVELVAEGAPAELNRLTDGVADAMRGNIESATREDGPATGEFSRFGMGY